MQPSGLSSAWLHGLWAHCPQLHICLGFALRVLICCGRQYEQSVVFLHQAEQASHFDVNISSSASNTMMTFQCTAGASHWSVLRCMRRSEKCGGKVQGMARQAARLHTPQRDAQR